MGQIAQCCAGDMFKKLYQQYGETFVKLMVCEKGKDVVRDQFGNIKTKADETFGGFTTKTNTLIDGKIGEVTKLYEDTKSKVPSFALEALEKQQGKPLDEISGFNTVKAEVGKIRKDTLGRVDSERNALMQKVSNSQDDMITKIEKDRPKIELYEELPDPVKKIVRDTAEKEFAHQLSENKQQIISMITSQFNLGNVQSLLSNLSPEKSLNGIVSGAGGKFLSNLTGGSGIPGIGNIGGGGGFGGFGF